MCRDPVKSSRRLGSLLLISLAFGAGCEDQSSIPLAALPGLGPASAQASRQILPDPCGEVADQDRLVQEMLNAVNAERAKAKLRPLRLNPTLSQIAGFYACRLIDGGFFQHVDAEDKSTVVTRAGDFGYPFWKIGENLAAEQHTVKEVMAAWMNSPGHRANILDPAFTEIGIAVKLGGEYGIYWVQEFGRPLTDGPPPATPTVSPSAPTQGRPSPKSAASQPVSVGLLPAADDAFPY